VHRAANDVGRRDDAHDEIRVIDDRQRIEPALISVSQASCRLLCGRRLVTGERISCSIVTCPSRYAPRSPAALGARNLSFIRSTELSMPTSRPLLTIGRWWIAYCEKQFSASLTLQSTSITTTA
jgi:hypothetical protein